MRGRVLALVVVVSVVMVAVATGTGAGPGPAPVALIAGPARLPLSAAAGSASQTFVAVPMGHLDDPANTFWELFVRPAGAASWTLRTPPGVASNGGIAADATPAGALTAGFLASFDLKFSPLAQSSDSGSTWSSGQLPGALAPVPDGLATSASGRHLALVSRAGQTVLSSAGGLSSWVAVASTRGLAGTLRRCGVTAITAVSFSPAGQPALGLACSRPGQVGVAVRPPTTTSSPRGAPPAWTLGGPTLPGGTGAATVVRLDDSGPVTTGLALVRSDRGTSLLAFSSVPGAPGRWVRSAPLPVPTGWTVQATATGGTGPSVAVLLASGGRRRVEVAAGAGGRWTGLPTAPRDAGAIARVGSETDAFVSSASRLAVWSLAAGATTWDHTATIDVPIQYGSSG